MSAAAGIQAEGAIRGDASEPAVDLVMSCYEMTYEKVLSRDHVQRIVDDCRYPFRSRIIVINNVTDRHAVSELAEILKSQDIIQRYVFVEDYIDCVLGQLHLKRADFGRIACYSSALLVSVSVGAAPYVLHWDADVRLLSPCDWITPCLRRLEQSDDALTANPLWNAHYYAMDVIRREARQEDEEFLVGYGFSDQLFLARAAELRRPIYKYRHPFSLRYPLAHISPIFEQRIDSYMRRRHRLRLTYKGVSYAHPRETEGLSYPNPTRWESSKKFLNRQCVNVARMMGSK